MRAWARPVCYTVLCDCVRNKLRDEGPRRGPGHGRGRHRQRAAGVHHRRAHRSRHPGGARAGEARDPQRRLQIPTATGHGQPRARRAPQGRNRLRPCDRGRRAPGGRLRAPTQRARPFSASLRSTPRYAPSPVSSPWRDASPLRASGGSSSRSRTPLRRRSPTASRCSAPRRCRPVSSTSAATASLVAGVRDASPAAPTPEPDLAAVRGQGQAKRALEIAAAGGHNLLMTGPPGAGKTMLARTLPSLLPDLRSDAALEVAAIYSLRGTLRERPPTTLRPPFRAPHHSISRAGLVGGGTGLAQPGEISLAHHGVLFLDELCEFSRQHLEALRQPLEEHSVTVARARCRGLVPGRLHAHRCLQPVPVRAPR